MAQARKSNHIIQEEKSRKEIVLEYFDLVKEGRFKEGLKLFSPDCVTHNPYVNGNMDTLTDAMISASGDINNQSSEPAFSVKQVLVDGDFVAVHTELLNSKSNAAEGGLRQVHLFRFNGDKVVEYWDITQQILPDMPNAGRAF